MFVFVHQKHQQINFKQEKKKKFLESILINLKSIVSIQIFKHYIYIKAENLIGIKEINDNHWQSLAIKAIWALKNSAVSPLP